MTTPAATSPTLFPLGDGIGSVALVQHVGDDKMIVSAARYPFNRERCVISFDMNYKEAIRRALQERYRVDTSDGSIYGPKGKLALAKRGAQRYPTVTLSVVGEQQFAVPAHKMVAFALYGEEAFRLHVRHLDADTLNLHPSNIALGTPSENEGDKPAAARRQAARTARAAQGPRPFNAKLSDQDIEEIRLAMQIPEGKRKMPNGTVKALCEKFGVSRTVINRIIRGLSYGN